jgi:molecular chaperone GrpE (heat shock protein)
LIIGQIQWPEETKDAPGWLSMANFIKKWIDGLSKRQVQEITPDEGLSALEGETQHLRLELEDRERQLERLKNETTRLRVSAQELGEAARSAQMERILADSAAPVAQLMTQAYLLDVQGRPLQARDVLAVARRLIQVLEEQGMQVVGKIGEIQPFDPDRHEPMASGLSIEPGTPVTVRFVGIAYQDHLLKKLGVEGNKE